MCGLPKATSLLQLPAPWPCWVARGCTDIKYIMISIVGVEIVSELMRRDDTNHDWWQ